MIIYKRDVPTKYVIKMENPGSFTFNYAASFFFSANNITYPMSIYLYTHWKLRSFFLYKYALSNIY